MKTVTVVINQDAGFAQTQLVIKDIYGFKHAKKLVEQKGFGNYSKNRFFIEIPIRNFDKEELVCYVKLRDITEWDYIANIECILFHLTAQAVVDESVGYTLLGGYMCHSMKLNDVSSFVPINPDGIQVYEKFDFWALTVWSRAKFSLPIIANQNNTIDS